MGQSGPQDGVAGAFDVHTEGGGMVLALKGAWTIATAGELDRLLRAVKFGRAATLTIDFSGIDDLDTAGAWLIGRTINGAEAELVRMGAGPTEIRGATPEQQLLVDNVRTLYAPCEVEPPHPNSIKQKVIAIGRSVEAHSHDLLENLAFAGMTMEVFFSWIRNPKRIRWTSFIFHMEQDGLNALPIVLLMSFLIGAVMAFLGGDILQQFGTTVFVVDMLSYGVFREFGVLLTTILIAGRSGSAFTAQIGSMKTREELDAMITTGLNPIELLVAPRVLALMAATPLLTILANVLGLFGGGLVAWQVFEISPSSFIARLELVFDLNDFWAGMIKAPVFAGLVGMIGCYQGLQVAGSAQSVGERTTRSVVESIFIVIVADALFAMYFVTIGF